MFTINCIKHLTGNNVHLNINIMCQISGTKYMKIIHYIIHNAMKYDIMY